MKIVLEATQRRVILDKNTLRDMEFRTEKNTTDQRVKEDLKENNRHGRKIREATYE